MSDPTLTRETLAKALSRKPVEGCSKGPWFLVDSEHGWQLWASHGKTGSMMIAQFPAAGFDELNAGLAAMSPDLQDENQILQAAVRELGKLLKRARPADVPLQTKPVLKDGKLVGKELQEMTAGERRRAWLNVDIDTTLALLPTERESDDTK